MGNFDFINNRTFDDRSYAFAPQIPQAEPGRHILDYVPLESGVKILENGDVQLGFYAPEAKSMSIMFDLRQGEYIPLEKDDKGIWKTVIPFDPTFVGPKTLTFYMDGAEVLNPYAPIYFSINRPINYVEIPDPNADFILMRDDIPHGSIVSEYYWSEPLESMERCLIYLPPSYHEGGEYPVLYLQHGYSENETSWLYNAKINHIMDNLIADGKAVPFIVVMCNGMFHGKFNYVTYEKPFEKSLIECVIPMIEKKYRVKKDKWGRGIAGFSMGSLQACLFGLRNQDVFSNIGLLSGFMRRVGRPETDLSKDLNLNDHLKIMMDKETFEREVRLFFRGIGSLDFKFDAFKLDDEICEEYGFDKYSNMARYVAEGYHHDWATMRVLFHEFAQLAFKR